MHTILHRIRAEERGFTLLELLLVIGVTAMIFLGIVGITQSWINTEVATSAGQHLQRVANVTAKFVEGNWSTLSNQDDVLQALAGGGATEWQGLEDALDQEGLLPGGVLRNPLGTDLQISFKNTGGIYRASIYAKTPLPVKKVSEAARQAGNYGGTVSARLGAGRAVGAYGQYTVNVTDLRTNPTFPCTVTVQNACLVAVISRNTTTLAGSFLYRTLVDGDPIYNTMTTDLIMNNRSVLGAANVTTQDLNVSDTASLGTTTVTGPATFNGRTTVAGGLTVPAGSSMSVSGNATFTNNVDVNGGTMNVDTLNSDVLRAPSIATQEFNASSLEVTGGAVAVNSNVNVNGNVTSSGQVLAGTINAGTIQANGGAIQVGSMTVNNTMQINQAVEITGGVIAADRLVADRCTRIYVGPGYPKYPSGWAQFGTCP